MTIAELVTAIAAKIKTLHDSIAAAYTAIEAKGVTPPVDKTAANLASAIDSIPSGSSEKVYIGATLNFRNNKSTNIHTELIDTSYVTSTTFSYSFGSINSEKLDMSGWVLKVTDFNNAFNSVSYCKSIIFGEGIDTSSCTNFSNMFYRLGCTSTSSSSKVTDVSIDARYFDFSSATNVSNMFVYAYGLISLKVGSGWNKGINLTPTSLGHDAIVEILQDLPTITDSQTMTFGSAKLALLSDAEKAIATNKGWELA